MAPKDNTPHTLDTIPDLINMLQQLTLLLQVSWFVAAAVIFGLSKASHVDWVVAPISSANKGQPSHLGLCKSAFP